jgi:hypothetical protein
MGRTETNLWGSYVQLWLPTSPLQIEAMELNGALSNPFATDKALHRRLSELKNKLLARASQQPRAPRGRPSARPPVLRLVTRVLENADRPMRASEIHAAANSLYGGSLLWHSVKEALSAYTIGGDRRFRRVGHGVYELDR